MKAVSTREANKAFQPGNSMCKVTEGNGLVSGRGMTKGFDFLLEPRRRQAGGWSAEGLMRRLLI